MIPAIKPSNEAARLECLRSFRLLDTPAEQAFDDVVLVASVVCETPIALVSLIDENRQWFKSRRGLDATETPRDQAFCAHAILDDRTLIVPDALEDRRFHDNPLVTSGPAIRFYAGSPLVTIDGFRLGTLCVIDTKPRQFETQKVRALEALARQVGHLLELRRSSDELARSLEEVRTLHEVLPICSYCKSIRDEEGAWQRLEKYVSDRTDTKFSHGICRTCMETNFPRIAASTPHP